MRSSFASRRIALAAALLVVVVGVGVVLGVGGGGGPRRPRVRPAAPAVVVAVPVVPRGLSLAGRERRAIDSLERRLPFVVGGGGARPDVALTFDDGPGPYTDGVLAVLRRERAPATFFVVGSMLRWFGAELGRELRGGFAVGDHTMTHPDLRGRSRDDQLAEIGGDRNLLRNDGVPDPRLFRPPYGAFDSRTLAALRHERMLAVLWTVDSEDYTRPGTARIVHNVLANVRPGAIVMLHDGGGDRSQTIAALPEIIRRLRRRGYHLVTVPRLLADDPPPRRQKPPPGVTE